MAETTMTRPCVATPTSPPTTRTRAMPAAAWWVACTSLAVLFLYPLYVMLSQSLKPAAEATAVPPTLYPHGLSLDNYRGLSNGPVDVYANLGNSVAVAVGATVATVVLSTLGGYAFARVRFPGSNVVFFAMLATFMIPFQAIITPLFLVLQRIGLHNSLIGLALVYTTFQLPFGLFLMRNSFAAIPPGLEEAAALDGAGIFRTLFSVMLPVAVPGLITTALFTFFASWNEFFAALILITDQDKFTLPVTLTLLSSGVFGSINWGLLQAGVALTVIPCIALYVVLQRYYVGGLMSGALK